MKCTGNRITVVAEGGKEEAETKEKKRWRRIAQGGSRRGVLKETVNTRLIMLCYQVCNPPKIKD